MKILLSVFACQPGLGSEDGLGWETTWRLAQHHRVHVLTTPRNRPAIEGFLKQHACDRLSFSYFDFSPVLLRVVVNSALWQIYYHCWQLRIADWAAAVAEEFDPDVVHHMTYGRYWTPCSLWKLKRPFVWGPLGGGDACPAAFLPALSWKERASERVRWLAQTIAHLDPALKATARHATLAVASTPATARRLESLHSPHVRALFQNAMSIELLSRQLVQTREPRTFCSVGRLLGWKGHALALRAFARAGIAGGRFVIVGEGPSRARLEILARELGIDSAVTFVGAAPRAEALAWIARSVALVHPSYHDQAATVIFEAMAAETPVIALDLGGATLQLTSEEGFLIEARDPAQAEEAIAGAMIRLVAEPSLRTQMGRAGRMRVENHFTWGKKATQLTELYQEAIGLNARGHAAEKASEVATAGFNQR